MDRAAGPRIYRVSDFNNRIRRKLESWGEVWIEGELLDVSRSGAGHYYFTLDDGKGQAQLRVVIFRGDARTLNASMEEGERVRVLGHVSLYEPRGSFQLIGRQAVSIGEGDRRAEIARIRKKLAKEGLLSPERKRPLPLLPNVVGVVTSLQGAAMHDVIRVAKGRAPVRLVVSHCQVQGAQAPASIVRALQKLYLFPGLDVVILTRGGGSAEDLNAFNDELVARAVAACPVPLISGVGHEVDDSICDLVADVRAATPSNAAELAVPEAEALHRDLEARRRRVERALEVKIGRGRLALEQLQRKLDDPRNQLGHLRQRFLEQSAGIERSTRRAMTERRSALSSLDERLKQRDPRASLAQTRSRLTVLSHRLAVAEQKILQRQEQQLSQAEHALKQSMGPRLERHQAALAHRVAELSALSPLSILGRGYCIAFGPDGKALRSAKEAKVGQRLELRLSEGNLRASVEEILP